MSRKKTPPRPIDVVRARLDRELRLAIHHAVLAGMAAGKSKETMSAELAISDKHRAEFFRALDDLLELRTRAPAPNFVAE